MTLNIIVLEVTSVDMGPYGNYWEGWGVRGQRRGEDSISGLVVIIL